ncbi:hypothetical protein ACHAXT_003860 [Thalassiosira profunda]
MAVLRVLCIPLLSLPLCTCFAPAAAPRAASGLQSHRGSGSSAEDTFRRRLLLAAPALLLSIDASNAAETTAEAIRLLSSKTIPGLGPPDVYYPPYFVGKWKATRIVTTSDDEFWGGITLPLTTVSEMRFVPYDAFSSDGNPNNVPAIADRSFNEKSSYTSLSGVKKAPALQTLQWTPTNPNVLSISYADGGSKEIKVTKRSSDVSKEGDAVFSSEFRRITDVPASGGSVAGGIPIIYKSRVLTKWKPGSTNENGRVDLIEGLEIAYNEAGTFGDRNPTGSFDPLTGRGGSGAISSMYGNDSKDLSDWRSTKTKILLERIAG